MTFTSADKNALKNAFEAGFKMPYAKDGNVWGRIELPDAGYCRINGVILSEFHMQLIKAEAWIGNDEAGYFEEIDMEELENKPLFCILDYCDNFLIEPGLTVYAKMVVERAWVESQRSLTFWQKIGSSIVNYGDCLFYTEKEVVLPEEYKTAYEGLSLQKPARCVIYYDIVYSDTTCWKVGNIPYAVVGDYVEVNSKFFIPKPDNLYKRLIEGLEPDKKENYEVLRSTEIILL